MLVGLCCVACDVAIMLLSCVDSIQISPILALDRAARHDGIGMTTMTIRPWLFYE